MTRARKTEQLQIRISKADKTAIQRSAAQAGMEVSAYVLARLRSRPAEDFARIVSAAGQSGDQFALAELNALLSRLIAPELAGAVAAGVPAHVTPTLANTIAAMVEQACARRGIGAPTWTREIEPLTEPMFGSTLQSLRLYLLTHSPPPFRRRNIFVDASVGDQV